MARLRTQEVAAQAGCAEGSIYRHFASKEDLLLAVILESVPAVAAVADADTAGGAPIEQALTDQVTAVYEHEQRMVLLALTVLGDEELHRRFQERLRSAGGGPQRLPDRIARYLAAEQQLGRLHSGLDPRTAAAMIQGSCFHHALLKRLHGGELFPVAVDDLIAGMVRNLANGEAS